MSHSRQLIVTGTPFCVGQPHDGVALGPAFLRQRGLIDRLVRDGAEVQDTGDAALGIAEGPWARAAAQADPLGVVSLACRRIADHLSRVIGGGGEGALQLVLGGDHAVGLATITATLRRHPDAGVVWLDAHGDMNTPANSPTGNFHGMPLGLLLDEFDEKHASLFDWVDVRLDPSRLVVIGARSLDPGEMELIARRGILVFTMDDLRRLGTDETLRRALAHLDSAGAGPIHLSLDIDALDPEDAPATGTPVERGLALVEARRICRFLRRSRRLAAVDLVEVNPELGRDAADANATAEAAIELIRAAVSPGRREALSLIPRRFRKEIYRASTHASRVFRDWGEILRKGNPA